MGKPNVYKCGESGGVLIICDGTVIEGGERGSANNPVYIIDILRNVRGIICFVSKGDQQANTLDLFC